MAYIFFIDESGINKTESPYEVLCGVAIEDKDIWNVISTLKNLEIQTLGTRYRSHEQDREIKGRKFLKRKTFKHASFYHDIRGEEIPVLAKRCLEQGASATRREQAGLALAKLNYVRGLLKICNQFRIKIFAAISSNPIRETDDKNDGLLRRDYVFLIERIYYYLDDKNNGDQGMIVFDEIGKSKSHILVSELENYFKKTVNGQLRSNLIIPEPFFVQSDLTTGIQIADIIAYIISWGFRLKGMSEPKREELNEFVDLIKPLRYRSLREINGNRETEVWSAFYVK